MHKPLFPRTKMGKQLFLYSIDTAINIRCCQHKLAYYRGLKVLELGLRHDNWH